MSWLQLQLRSDSINAPALEELLENSGAVSVTLLDAADQPLYEPAPGETPLWQEVLVTGLFPGNTDAETVIKDLTAALQPAPLPPVQVSVLQDQNWHRTWMNNFKPMSYGERLWVCPSWCEVPDQDAVTLMLDPGLAFGTGTHPTTALCLQWLDQCELDDQEVIDYGCGSGILGMAALLLGAKHVLGVDTDPQALLATRDNCQKNHLTEEQFPVVLARDFNALLQQQDIPPADGVLANILAEPLMELAPVIATLVRPGGWLLLSGILEKQSEQVMTSYSSWFEFSPPVTLEGWVRLQAHRN